MKIKRFFPVLLIISIVLVAAGVLVFKGYPAFRTLLGLPEKTAQTETVTPPKQEASQQPQQTPETPPTAGQTQEPTTQPEEQTQTGETDPEQPEDPVTPPDEPVEEPKRVLTDQVVDSDYFDDALFIGDSRTVGLEYYGGFDNATYFAETSMSVFGVMDRSVEVTGKGTYSLAGLLSDYQFNKIYIMLGINEVGYDYSAIVAMNQELVDMIRQYQPQAAIIFQANIHVSYSRSSTDSVVNNTRIDTLNSMLSELADGEHVFYVDFNYIYDDEGGNLNEDYTGDSTHMYAKYYPDWGEWLLHHAVILPEWENA